MKIKIRNFWHRLQASFWFLPALLAAAAILLSFVTTAIDKSFLYRESARQWLIYSGGPDGARTVLSVIAGSMITVAGVVFSITIVVLSLASSQFGPRLIRNFMNVRANKMVLGTYVATFIYGVLVLRTVNATVEEIFVPNLSVTIAIVMSLLSLGVLIYFNMIRQNSQSVAAVSIHLLETIATVAAQTIRKEDRAALLRHAAMVAHGCKETLSADDDRKDLDKRYEAAVKTLNEESVRIDLNPESPQSGQSWHRREVSEIG